MSIFSVKASEGSNSRRENFIDESIILKNIYIFVFITNEFHMELEKYSGIFNSYVNISILSNKIMNLLGRKIVDFQFIVGGIL